MDPRPADPRRPQVGLDETRRQVRADVAPPQPGAPGRPARQDYADARDGVVTLVRGCAPLRGGRHVTVSDRRTRSDWAPCSRALVAVHYADAAVIVLVLAKLTTHAPASWYAAFPPAEAKRLAATREIHSTPTQGSWLDIAESELRVLAAHCLDRRLPDRATLTREVAAWEAARHAAHHRGDWRCTSADARLKLQHLYPAIED